MVRRSGVGYLVLMWLPRHKLLARLLRQDSVLARLALVPDQDGHEHSARSVQVGLETP
jgi:hypothetical protein